MRKSKADTAKTRTQILSAATTLFLEKGLGSVTVADVMKAAGLTHGGFYNHFRSKEDLQAAAIAEAFRDKLDMLSAQPQGAAAVMRYLDEYLSHGHVTHLAKGCPIAGLAVDANRSGSEASAAMEGGTMRIVELITEGLGGADDAKDRAVELLSGAIGAIVLARSVTDPGLRDRIVEVARRRLDSVK